MSKAGSGFFAREIEKNEMPTINQLVKSGRDKQKRKTAAPALKACPQKRGVCIRVYTSTPKKPNSALRKVAPRSPHQRDGSDQLHPGRRAQPAGALGVLIRGGRVKDLPGVRYHIVRGTLDTAGVTNRRQSRSKYGAKRPK